MISIKNNDSLLNEKYMKLVVVVFFVVAFLFLSCQKEIKFANTGNTNNNSSCKACAYMPMCDGSVYSYYDTTFMASPVISSDTLQFLKDTSFNGRTYQKFITRGNVIPVYANCTNGVFRNAVLNVAATGGTVSFELRTINDNLPVNGIWDDTIQNGLGQTVIYKNTIKEKAVSKTVHSKTFTDVIHVETIAGVDFPPLGFVVTNKSDYYFARGTGLIEAVVANEDGSIVYQHRVIKSYNIP